MQVRSYTGRMWSMPCSAVAALCCCTRYLVRSSPGCRNSSLRTRDRVKRRSLLGLGGFSWDAIGEQHGGHRRVPFEVTPTPLLAAVPDGSPLCGGVRGVARGGTLIIGLDEKEPGGSPLTPVDLGQVTAKRIEQVAEMKVDPPLAVECTATADHEGA